MEEFEDSLSNTVRLPHTFFELLIFFIGLCELFI